MSDEKNKKYWDIKNKTDESADLYIYNEIASWGEGNYATSARSFKRDLDDLGNIKELNIYINSPGGSVFEGISICNMLKRKKYIKNVYIDGLAASIASVIAMAGDNIIMPKNSMIMIHNPWTFTYGNAKDLRETADRLDKICDSIKETYLEKAGDFLDYDTLTELMNEETWFSADEAFDIGLCTKVEEESSVAACISDDLFKNYINVPEIYKNKDSSKSKENNKKENDNNKLSDEETILRKKLIEESKNSIDSINKILGIN